eukprot:SAG31_NODE_34519_length_332_cov_0.690987_1_plen_73_part_10
MWIVQALLLSLRRRRDPALRSVDLSPAEHLRSGPAPRHQWRACGCAPWPDLWQHDQSSAATIATAAASPAASP